MNDVCLYRWLCVTKLKHTYIAFRTLNRSRQARGGIEKQYSGEDARAVFHMKPSRFRRGSSIFEWLLDGVGMS